MVAPSNPHESGFTLLELIVVCVLIGIMLVVSVPSLRNTLLGDPLKTNSRKLIGLIRGVRDEAVRTQQPYYIYFDLDEHRVYHLPASADEAEKTEAPKKDVLQLSGDAQVRDIWTKAKGEVQGGIYKLWVSREGYVAPTVIHLDNDSGDSLSLVLSPFLPRIEVRDGTYVPQ